MKETTPQLVIASFHLHFFYRTLYDKLYKAPCANNYVIDMKSSLLTLVFSVAFVALLTTTFFMPASATIVAESVKFEPKYMDLTNPEEIVTATIRFGDPYSEEVLNIDPATVLLEGSLPLLSWNTGTKPPEFIADFDGYMVRDILWAKVYHMGAMEPNPHGKYMVYLTITGELYDETPFTGTGHIKVTVPQSSPPPPPPP